MEGALLSTAAVFKMDSLAAGKMGMGTKEVGNMVSRLVKEA